MTEIKLHFRSREQSSGKIVERVVNWDVDKTTIVICDMWDQFWCPRITSVDFIGGEPFRFKDDKRTR